jgi:hypothetical protein
VGIFDPSLTTVAGGKEGSCSSARQAEFTPTADIARGLGWGCSSLEYEASLYCKYQMIEVRRGDLNEDLALYICDSGSS